MSNPNNPINPDEQPTRVAPSGSQETAGQGQQTWQNTSNQPGGGLGSQFAAQENNSEGETRVMPQNPSTSGRQYAGAPGQYPPVPGSTSANGSGPTQGSSPQYGTNAGHDQNGGYGSAPQTQNGAQNGQWNPTSGTPEYGAPGQYPSSPNYSSAGYDSNQPAGAGAQASPQYGAPAYATTGQQYAQHPADRQYTTDHGATAPAASRNGLGAKLGWGMVATALLAIIGVFGTWLWVKLDGGAFGNFHASTNGIGMESSNLPDSGTKGDNDVKDGWFVLIPAILVLVLGVLRALGKIRKTVAWAAAALSAIAAGVAIYDYFDIRDKLNDLKDGADSTIGFSAGSGWGLTLCLIAALLMLVTSVLSALRD